MLCEPAARELMVSVACPDVSVVLAITWNNGLMNVTVPVGVPAVEEIVTVSVIGCPYVDGLGDDMTAVDVEARLTV